MGRETERGGFIKRDKAEPADIAEYNANIDRIEAEVMSIPYAPTNPPGNETWPGKIMLRDSGDPTFFLPQVRAATQEGFWYRASSGTWESFTPESTQLTIGNGSLRGRFTYVGSLVFAEILVLFGSTTVVTGNLAFGMPSAHKLRVPTDFATEMRSCVGTWMARCGAGAPANLYKGRVLRRGTNVGLDLDPRTVDSPALILNATRPNTWQNGNRLHLQVSGEADW